MNHTFDDIRAFLRVVDSGGIGAAATRLGVSKSSLSARIRRLERSLRVELLHRSTRGVALTDAGRRFHERMQDIMVRMQEAIDEIASGESNDRLIGHLRITAPMTFGTEYVNAFVFAFMAKHPALDVTLDLDDRCLDILAGGYDLGVRIGRLPDSSLMARRIAASPRVLCCSPAYATQFGQPANVAALQDHACICYGSSSVAPYWQFQAEAGDDERLLHVVVRGRTHLNNGESMRDAAIAGLGLAILPLFIAGPALRAGQLQVVLPETPPTEDAIYAVYPPTRYVSQAVRVLIDSLVTHFEHFPWSSTGAVMRDIPPVENPR